MTEETLFFNGKKYISSRRASEISSYSIDYLGQLSRKGILESEMVGRNRYVCESSLSDYLNKKSNKSKKEFAQKKLSEIKNSEETSKKDKAQKAADENKGPSKEAPAVAPIPFKVPEGRPTELQSFGYAFRQEKDFSENAKRYSLGFKKQFFGSIVVAALMFMFLNLPIAKDGMDNFLSALSLSTEESFEVDSPYIVPTSTSVLKENKNIELIEVLQSVDRSFIGVLQKVDNAVISFFRKLRRNTINLAVNVRDRFISKEETRVVFKEEKTTEESTLEGATSEEGVSAVTEEQLRKIVRQILLDEQDIFAPGGPYGGIITNPSGTPEEDADFVRRVEETFSDEVTVEFDDSRGYGRVRPVFRNTDEVNDDYLFVFVPVNE